MRSSVLIAALAAVAACVAGTGSLRADVGTVQEMVVYVAHRDADLAAIRSACHVETGLAAPTEESDLAATETSDGGRILVYRVRGSSDRDTRRGATRLMRNRWVTDVFVNSARKVRGAPTQIPVIEGDLEPRSVSGQPAMAQVGMARAAARGTGRGVLVAVLDGGFDLRHECLDGRVGGRPWDAVDRDDDPQDLGNGVDDDDDGTADALVGHGTFTSSLVLAGAADATVLPIRVLDDEGWGSPLAVAEAIQYAIDQRADVINMSLVVSSTTPMVRDAVRAALDAGIVVVSAAGNERTWQNDPQLARRVITVGATDPAGDVAAFSVTGSHVHVYAPGVAILGALGGARRNDYATWQGTSFAAPFVAALAAIVREESPGLTPEQLRQIVIDASVPLDAARSPGRGRLDAAAVADAAALE